VRITPFRFACPAKAAAAADSANKDPATANAAIVEGYLPPGLAMDADGTIHGIGRERGHWFLTIRPSAKICPGPSTPLRAVISLHGTTEF
jgi:hypothetical protein